MEVNFTPESSTDEQPVQRGGTIRSLQPEAFPKGNEELGQEIDSIVYDA